MSRTDVLAWWGAVTGTIGSLGGATAVVTITRDRPQVRLTGHQVSRGLVDPATPTDVYEFTAVNVGRRGITILQAGYALHTTKRSMVRWSKAPVLWTDADGAPHALEPGGQPLIWEVPISETEDRGIAQGFVKDSHGHFHWAKDG